MIVVAIVGILAAIAIPNFVRFQVRARQSECKMNLKAYFAAEKSYYGDKGVYCSALDVVGFLPERNNRYQYNGTAANGFLLQLTAGTATPVPGVASNCGVLSADAVADPNLYEGVGSDVFKWGPPAIAYTFSPLVGVVFAPNVIGGVVPATVGVAGSANCQAGVCEFVASCQGNLDNDPTNDEWVIASTSGTATSVGSFADGEPVNTVNDVNL